MFLCCHGSDSICWLQVMDVRCMSNYTLACCLYSGYLWSLAYRWGIIKKTVKVISYFLHFPPAPPHAFLIAADLCHLACIALRSGQNWGCYTMTAKRDFTHRCLADSSWWKIQHLCRHRKSTCPYGSVRSRLIPRMLGVKQTRSYLGACCLAPRCCMCRIAINQADVH